MSSISTKLTFNDQHASLAASQEFRSRHLFSHKYTPPQHLTIHGTRPRWKARGQGSDNLSMSMNSDGRLPLPFDPDLPPIPLMAKLK